MTGYGNPETEREAFRKGANHYILKPFRNEDLMEAMSQAGLADAEATPARVMEPMVERRHVRHSVVMDRIQPVLRHVLNVLRQAKAVFLDRWYNPPILFERDPSFEERISLRLSLITDPIKVIFYGLFDKEFEFPMDERAEEMRPSRPPAEEEPGPIHPPPMDRPLPRFSSIDMTPEPVEMEPGVERVHQDLSLQINSLAQSLQAQIGKLAEQIQQRPEAPKAPDPMPDPLPGSRESPQEEFHRLLIELQASWDQGLTGLEKELSVSQELLNEWNKTLPVLRQTVDRPQAA
jgi:CheY-like chemotaxis protein